MKNLRRYNEWMRRTRYLGWFEGLALTEEGLEAWIRLRNGHRVFYRLIPYTTPDEEVVKYTFGSTPKKEGRDEPS